MGDFVWFYRNRTENPRTSEEGADPSSCELYASRGPCQAVFCAAIFSPAPARSRYAAADVIGLRSIAGCLHPTFGKLAGAGRTACRRSARDAPRPDTPAERFRRQRRPESQPSAGECSARPGCAENFRDPDAADSDGRAGRGCARRRSSARYLGRSGQSRGFRRIAHARAGVRQMPQPGHVAEVRRVWCRQY